MDTEEHRRRFEEDGADPVRGMRLLAMLVSLVVGIVLISIGTISSGNAVVGCAVGLGIGAAFGRRENR